MCGWAGLGVWQCCWSSGTEGCSGRWSDWDAVVLIEIGFLPPVFQISNLVLTHLRLDEGTAQVRNTVLWIPYKHNTVPSRPHYPLQTDLCCARSLRFVRTCAGLAQTFLCNRRTPDNTWGTRAHRWTTREYFGLVPGNHTRTLKFVCITPKRSHSTKRVFPDTTLHTRKRSPYCLAIYLTSTLQLSVPMISRRLQMDAFSMSSALVAKKHANIRLNRSFFAM